MDYRSDAFTRRIAPFQWMEHDGSYSFLLDAGEYLADLFLTREEEGFEGNGYDWQALAQVFLDEQFEGEAGALDFDSEAGMFVMISEDGDALADFALAFKEACEDAERIADLFSRAELV